MSDDRMGTAVPGVMCAEGTKAFCGKSYACLREQMTVLIGHLRCAMYPEFFEPDCDRPQAESNLEAALRILAWMLERVFPEPHDCGKMAGELIRELPAIQRILETDVQAAYEGDPAAQSRDEIILAYPAFEAISAFRVAHKLYRMKVPILPRMMTEYAHSRTGIDIHPGATIGSSFFIDHGTGVVIGETTIIGDHVKLYQGVTLGAKSFGVDKDGALVKGNKRHPDIGSNVVIYAGATILGGETVIGDNCVIGGNVWLTHSVESGNTVLAAHEQTYSVSKHEIG
ncbi:MAG: serine O-acetyltransferase EpsC [Oscillospiraceae bacterium]|nr:serine O-acetyltransferase EpsC [Oscillospiraceae bacterium]